MADLQVSTEVMELLGKPGITRAGIRRLRAVALSDPASRKAIEDHLPELEAAGDKALHAAALWALGRCSDALEVAGSTRGNLDAKFVSAMCHVEMNEPKKALSDLESALEKDPAAPDLIVEIAGVKASIGDLQGALDTIEKVLKKDSSNADAHFLKGFCLESQFDLEDASTEYEKVLSLKPSHAKAAFRLGYLFSLRGEEEQAVTYYERCVSGSPTFLHGFLNLGTLYEDLGQYDKAINCYKRALSLAPDHPRAALFLKDAVSSLDMYYDEEQEKRADREHRILQTPISEFELSIRSRNCLEKMSIRTLGDLVHANEQDLLSYKNFGETSLNEIKQLLSQKGFHLGQGIVEGEVEKVRQALIAEEKPDDKLSKPISELGLSIRGRRCMETLGIATLGDLIQKTEHDLLACKNFGQTSLREIKKKLSELGLSLKQLGAA